MKPIKVLSLFDGMACGLIALKELGVTVDRYIAFEIDKYAIKTSSHNFPEIEHRGDVFEADFTEFEGFDLLCGGSPCTYWSIAQSPNKRETTASGIGWDLFSQYVRALKEAKPEYFIYENNKSMAKAIYQSISEAFGFEPIMINSALVSAQSRKRYYWVGKRNESGTYDKVNIQQPEDRGILLKDILVGKSDGINDDIQRARTIKAQYMHTSFANAKRQDSLGATMVAEPVQVGALPRPNGELSTSQAFRIYSDEGKAVTLKACGGGAGGKTGLYAIPVEFDDSKPTKAISCADGKTYIVHEVKDGQITIKGKTYPIKLIDGFYIIRKLTVLECMRLQTVPEWYKFPVSDTQAYKMLGNGWTVDVIAHILSYAKWSEKEVKNANL